MCPNCAFKDRKIYELSLRLGVKKRQNEILTEELERARGEIYFLRKLQRIFPKHNLE